MQYLKYNYKVATNRKVYKLLNRTNSMGDYSKPINEKTEIHPATRIAGTIICGGIAALCGSIAGSIEGTFSSFAMPTNLRTLYQRIPEKLEEVFGEAKPENDYFDKVGTFAYHAVKYPTRIAGNIAVIAGIERALSEGNFGLVTFFAATNAISCGYEFFQAGKKSAQKNEEVSALQS